MHPSLFIVALLAGAGLVVQVGMNARIGAALAGSTGAAAAVNFAVGLAGLLAFLLATQVPLPTRTQMGAVPAWAWFGGLLGAFYVCTATFVGPRIGALLLLALTLAGQMTASLVVDHYGLLGFAQHPVTLTKLAGVALLVAGIVLVAK
jgi:bacterial/archaeal transporter family-2 protein